MVETKPFFVFRAYVVKEYITIPNDREKKNFSMLGIRDNQKLTLNVHQRFTSNLNQTISGNVYSLTKRFNKNEELVVTLLTTLRKLPESVKETKVTMSNGNIDLSLGNLFTKTISGATTLTVSNVPTSGTVGYLILELTNGGSGAITWFSGVKWAFRYRDW